MFQEINIEKTIDQSDIFFNLTVDMLCVCDKIGNFIKINNSFTATVGFDENEILEQNFFNFIHPDDMAEAVSVLNTLSNNSAEITFENRYLCKNKKYLCLSWRAVQNQQNIYLIAKNCTETKQLQKRAKLLVDKNKKLISLNLEKESRADELVVAYKELAFQNQEKENRAGELVIANKELAFQNQEKGNRASELVIANKELAFQNDEKEKRKQENQKLEAFSYAANLASQYSLSLIEASRDPLVTINIEGKITDMNQAMVVATGVSRKKLKGTDFKEYFTDPKKASKVYKEVFSKGFVIDYPLTIKDNNLTDVLFNGSVYKDENKNVVGAVIVARDVTEQKRIATELIEAKTFAELATEISEIAKVKAQTATRIAEEAVKSKQQFLSNMSHEIRTPMNAIIGFTKVVLKTDLTPKQKEFVQAIKVSGDALIVLINDILDLAKVDSGKMTFEQAPFKLETSMAAMLHLFETKIQEKNLKLEKKYDHKIPKVILGDATRLHQIILNLVSNAVKFTSNGKITVATDLLHENDSEVVIAFSISDTGIGILDTEIDAIFENFQQATSSTSRIFGGTGLGLAIVKQLVEAQGGAILVKSEPEKGSTFSFTMPFKKTSENAIAETEILELDLEISNLKVLVVEDIPLNQLLMRTLLDDFGFDCEITSNGRIAVEKLKTTSYDIILMDLQMPEMDGFEATKYIRSVLKLEVPILALTADVTSVDVEKCRAVGMNDYLAKPVDEKLLYTKIVSLVKKNQLNKNQAVIKKVESENIRCIDLNYLNERTKSNPVLMLEMISLYLEQTPPLITAMKVSFQNRDWDMLGKVVHKIIPSFSIMGINVGFEKMAHKIQEYAITMQNSDDINVLIIALETVLLQSCQELTEEMQIIKNKK